MKSLAIAVFSFLAGLFAPEFTSVSSLSWEKLTHIDPVAVAFIVIWLFGVSLLIKKRKGGKGGKS